MFQGVINFMHQVIRCSWGNINSCAKYQHQVYLTFKLGWSLGAFWRVHCFWISSMSPQLEGKDNRIYSVNKWTLVGCWIMLGLCAVKNTYLEAQYICTNIKQAKPSPKQKQSPPQSQFFFEVNLVCHISAVVFKRYWSCHSVNGDGYWERDVG